MRRLSGLMSVKATSISENSGTVSRSESSRRVKPMLPAPMNATLNDMDSTSFCLFLMIAIREGTVVE